MSKLLISQWFNWINFVCNCREIPVSFVLESYFGLFSLKKFSSFSPVFNVYKTTQKLEIQQSPEVCSSNDSSKLSRRRRKKKTLL